MWARDAGLVDGLGRVEAQRPGHDFAGRVRERLRDDLPGERVESRGGDGPCVDVQPDGCGMVHGEPLPCLWQPGWLPASETRPLSALTHGLACRGDRNALLISSFEAGGRNG